MSKPDSMPPSKHTPVGVGFSAKTDTGEIIMYPAVCDANGQKSVVVMLRNLNLNFALTLDGARAMADGLLRSAREHKQTLSPTR